MAEGNRKDPRARVLNMTVRYKSATVDEFIENHSHDISRGGIFIKTRAPFPAGTLLKFEVRIAEDQRLMQGVGRVVWRREPERAEDGFPAGMGIKFIKTGEGAAELISQIVDARQGQESSFDAGARQNGADADAAPRSDGARHPAVVVAPEVSEPPHPDTPSLQVESSPTSLPTEGELRVSSPPKKRTAASETRKVVLQGAAFEAPSSNKTPSSTQARAAAAQAAAERAPSRPASAGKGRNSFADETTSPRARAAADSKRARAAAQQQSSPSIYGLVAILGVVGVGLIIFKVTRSPEAEPAAPAPAVTASTPPPSPTPPSPPAARLPSAAPSAAAPAAETGEGAGEPTPAAATPSAPTAVVPAPAASAGAGGAATKPGVPPAATPLGTAAPKSAAPTAAAPPAPAKPPATATPPAAAKPATVPAAPPAKPPVAAAPAVAPKPKVAPKAAPAAGEPTVSIRPSTPDGDPGSPGSAGAANAAEARPGEPAKKHPPAATAPGEPEPPRAAPSPKPAPSDDNPY